MIVRRAFYYWQFIAAFILPGWLLLGWGAFGRGGWGMLGLIILCPVVFLSLMAIASLIYARKQVRETRTVSWVDVVMLSVWHASIIGIGFFDGGTRWFAIIAVVLAIVCFWVAIWELVREARSRLSSALSAAGNGEPRPTPSRRFGSASRIIIVEEANGKTAGRGHH